MVLSGAPARGRGLDAVDARFHDGYQLGTGIEDPS
jgi:hypothetical protein